MGRQTMAAVLTLVALLFLARDAGALPPALDLPNITQYTPTAADFASGSGLITAAQCRQVRADPSSMFAPRSRARRRPRPSATFQRGRYVASSLAPREARPRGPPSNVTHLFFFSSCPGNERPDTTRDDD